MELYNVMLFLHIGAAIGLIGVTLMGYPVSSFAHRAGTVSALRPLVGLLSVIGRTAPIMAVLTLLPALYLAFSGDWWGDGWVMVSLVLFVVAGGIAGAVIDPRVKALAAATAEAPEGAVPTQLRALLGDRVMHIGERVLTSVDVAILFLMTNKPGYSGALALAIVAVVVGAVWGVATSRGHEAAPAAAA